MTASDQYRGKLCFPSVRFNVGERGRLQRVESVHTDLTDVGLGFIEMCHLKKKSFIIMTSLFHM